MMAIARRPTAPPVRRSSILHNNAGSTPTLSHPHLEDFPFNTCPPPPTTTLHQHHKPQYLLPFPTSCPHFKNVRLKIEIGNSSRGSGALLFNGPMLIVILCVGPVEVDYDVEDFWSTQNALGATIVYRGWVHKHHVRTVPPSQSTTRSPLLLFQAHMFSISPYPPACWEWA